MVNMNQTRNRVIALLTTAIALGGCIANRSTDPDLAPWVGQTVTLTSTYKVCIPFSYQNQSWIDLLFFWTGGLTTPYVMQDAQYELACRQDANELIATLPPGTSAEVVKFEQHNGLISVEGNRQVILQVPVPDHDPPTVLALFELPFGDNTPYQFPWAPLDE
jgi:hypothetical protein